MEESRPYPATVRQLAEEIHKLEADLDDERVYSKELYDSLELHKLKVRKLEEDHVEGTAYCKQLYDSLELCVGLLWATMHLTCIQNGDKGKQFLRYAEAVKLVGVPCAGCAGESCKACGGIGFVPKNLPK